MNKRHTIIPGAVMYTGATALTSAAVGTAQRWADAIRAHNPGEADLIARSYFALAPRYGLNADLALAQSGHETGWFTSAHWTGTNAAGVRECNPAGLGITGAPDQVVTYFGTVQRAAAAHFEHLCCYVYTAAACPADHTALADPRHFFHDGRPALADLERLPARGWANPGTGYVAAICAIANQVTGGVPPMANPYDRTHLAADVGPSRAIGDVRWFVVHDTEGSFPGDESVLTSAAAPIESVHFLVGRAPGQCVLMVPLDTTAWTAGNDQVSEQAIQVELSHNPARGETDYTAYQYAKLAEIFNWCVAQGMVNVPAVYIGRRDADGGPEPDLPGIIGHQDVPDGAGGWGGSGHHTDPGPTFDWGRFVALIGGAPAPSDSRTFPETGKSIAGPFKGAWERFDDDAVSLELFGFPITEVRTENGAPVQYFQRARFEQAGGRVRYGLIGAELLRARGEHGPGID